MTTLSRPQPLGVLSLPAGWLVLPAQELADPAGETAAARDRLMTGMLPAAWPTASSGSSTVRAIELALAGDVAAAGAEVDPDRGPEQAYNHFVLTGEPTSLAKARAGATGDLAALVAVAAYSLGRAAAADLPDPDEQDGEVAAHVLAARAAAHLEAHDPQGALDCLVAAEQAAQEASPVLAALLLGQQAALLQEVNGADPDVVRGYVDAVDALRGMDAVEPAMAELALGLATAYQELAAQGGEGAAGAKAGLLVEAVRTYHLALRLLRKDTQPERYAFAHSNLALCYLAMPMSDARDTLRRGVAVQSLREAQKIYTRERYPREWAAVTLNLANSLQHLPTTHPVENLVEAVDMYEELLVARPVEVDPIGHARVLANQGTALAHLGIHDQARPKLEGARELFAAAGDSGAVATVDAALADLAVALAAGPSGVEVTS